MIPIRRRSVTVAAVICLLIGSTPLLAAERVDDGLVVLYDFSDGTGNVVRDRSGDGEPLDLVISEPAQTSWQNDSLLVNGPTRIVSDSPALKLTRTVRASGSITIEAWLRPQDASQTGPARIVSLSDSPSRRSFTLGQDQNRYDVRFRTTSTDQNGNPSLAGPAGTLSLDVTHVVYTRDPAGNAILYVNARPVSRKLVAGGLNPWDERFRLTLVNELTGDRPWLGELHLVAVYSRSLSESEVQTNFAAGPDARGLDPKERIARLRLRQQQQHFEQRVAPLLAQHCLECHDPSRPSGGLDLSQREPAVRGGDSGRAFVPGDLKASLLWDHVASNEMPKDRSPLSDNERLILKSWIESGATWTVERIDPAEYVHSRQAGEIWVQRLTVPEYIETVRISTGVDISREARELLPADLRADGFRNTAYNLGVDLKHVEAYARLAEITVERMDIAKFARKFSPNRKFNDDKMREFVAAMGRHLLRGPLDANEITVYSGVATTVASAGGNYDEAVRYLIEAMLQSPRFIYRIENHRGSGGMRPVSPYELASRFSYILWGGPPDERLLESAESGVLTDPRRMESEIDRMLADERARRQSVHFVSDWLNLDRLANLRPNAERFPGWSSRLAQDMRGETIRYFEDVVWEQKRPLADLMNAQVTFATPELAAHYGWSPSATGWARYELADVPGRGGLLTQASVLTIGGDDASMVSRGLFVFHDLLRGTVNAPPPCVNTTPPATREGLTQRGIAESRIEDNRCGVCHARFEPLAFGLERFDGIGTYREQDGHGNALRDDGEILFPGTARPVAYRSSAEMMNLLAGSERVRESLTWKVTQFALGRPLTATDAAIVRSIHERSQQEGGTWSATMRAIVLSDLVQKTRTAPGH